MRRRFLLESGSILAAGLAVLALPWVLRSNESNWVWGLNITHYLPPGQANLRLGLGLLTLAVAMALFLRRLPRSGNPVPQSAPVPPGRSDFFSAGAIPWRLLLGAAIGVVFWLYREQIHFLGDTTLRLRSMYGAVNGNPDVPAWVLHAAPLDYLLLVQLPVRLARLGGLDIFQAAQMVPCMIGAVFALVAIRAARECTGSTMARWVVLALVLSQGYVEIFAGYCKGYGLLLTCLLAWCAACWREDRLSRRPFESTLMVALALLTHRTGLFLVPAQVWRISRSQRAGRRPQMAEIAAMALAVACLAALVYSWKGVAGQDLALLVHSLNGGGEPGAYSIFSSVHVANVLNDLFLLAPLGMAGLVVVMANRWSGTRLSLGASWWLAAAPFLLMACLVPSLYPVQGAMRDWDNFAGAGIFLALLVARSAARGIEADSRHVPLWGFAILASLLHSSAWLQLNASEGAALQRVDAISRGVPALPLSARGMLFEYLGEYRELKDQPALAAEAYLEAAALVPNPRFFILAGNELWDAGRRPEAREAFRTAARRDETTGTKMLILASQKLAADPSDSLSQCIRSAVLEVRAAGPSGKSGKSIPAGLP